MTFVINGVDFAPYIAFEGTTRKPRLVKTKEGFTLGGDAYIGVSAQKIDWDVTLNPMTSEALKTALDALSTVTVEAMIEDPEYGTELKQYITESTPAKSFRKRSDGTQLWTGMTFTLMEK